MTMQLQLNNTLRRIFFYIGDREVFNQDEKLTDQDERSLTGRKLASDVCPEAEQKRRSAVQTLEIKHNQQGQKSQESGKPS